jgi:erythromycin esterase-like protein
MRYDDGTQSIPTRMDCIRQSKTKPRAIALIGAIFLSHTMGVAASPSVVDQAVGAACTKKIVLLGELPSHGESKAFQTKAQIVKRLVETCGFNAIIFEAPLYEFELAAPSVSGRKPSASDLDNGIGRFWTTNELANWRAWLANRWSSGRLRLGGMDDQPSATSRLTTRYLPALVASAVPERKREECGLTVRRHLEWSYTDLTPFDATEKSHLLACASIASRNVPSISEASPKAVMLQAFNRYANRQVDPRATPTRDDSMFEGVRWHLKTWPSSTRVIVWTATVHASRERSGRSDAPLGQHLAAIYGDRLMSIGFTAAGGNTSKAGANPTALTQAPEGSLEMLALGRTAESAYVHGQTLRQFNGKKSQLLGTFVSAAWSHDFDGVVVFRHEEAPTFPARAQPR